MNRRQVLAAGALAVAGPLAGCSEDSPSTLTPVGSARDPPDGCGRADQPLSHRLTDDPGDSAPCPEAVTPSLAVENERSAPVAVDLDLDAVADSYTLAPGERTVAERAVELASPPAGSVTVDGETWRVEWPGRSCRRHGIAVGDQPEIGWVAPASGGDCYPGTPVPLRVDSTGRARTVTVTVTEACGGERRLRTLTLAAGTSRHLDSLVEAGGRYTVTVSVDGETTETAEFRDVCGGLVVSIFGNRPVRIDVRRR